MAARACIMRPRNEKFSLEPLGGWVGLGFSSHSGNDRSQNGKSGRETNAACVAFMERRPPQRGIGIDVVPRPVPSLPAPSSSPLYPPGKLFYLQLLIAY